MRKSIYIAIISLLLCACKTSEAPEIIPSLANTEWGCMYDDIEYVISFYDEDTPQEGYKSASLKKYDRGNIEQSPLYYKFDNPDIVLDMYEWHSYKLLPVPFSETVEGKIYNDEMIFKGYSFNRL